MTFPLVTWADAGLVLLYVAVLWLPGLGALLAAGSRGWTAVAVAPLATYGIAGVAGPVGSGLGVPWSPLSLVVAALLAIGIGAGVRRATRRWADPDDMPGSGWSRVTTIGVVVSVAVAALVGAGAVLGGIRRLTTIPQDWDAAFHANGIAWIARTGDGGLTGMSHINWYGSAPAQYYPNAYHLLGATISDLTGRDVPSILNAHTLLIPGVLALGIAALCHRLGTRGLVAAASAVVAVGVSSFYDMLWRGPLLPFAIGVALIPALLVVLLEYLSPSRVPRRLPDPRPARPGGVRPVRPAPRGVHRGRAVRRGDDRVVVDPDRSGASPPTSPPSGSPPSWPSSLSCRTWPELAAQRRRGVDRLAGRKVPWRRASARRSCSVTPPTASRSGSPCCCCWAGSVWLRFDTMRWILVPALIFVGAVRGGLRERRAIVETVTRPWWNDSFRLIGIATIPLALLAGHGLSAGARRGHATSRSAWSPPRGPARRRRDPGVGGRALLVSSCWA